MKKIAINSTHRHPVNPLLAAMLSALGSLALLSSGAAQASGFSLNEMSAASVGNAHAGGAAIAEDISTIYYNPAGLSRMSGTQFMVVGSGIRPSAKFTNNGSAGNLPGTMMTGGNGGDAGDWAFVPAIYYAMDLTPQMRFGIGLQTPFGLKTDYDANWVGRYQALTSDMKTYNINPSLSYKLNDMVAFGAGISAEYIDVKLSQAIDFRSACFGALAKGAPIPGGAATCAATADGSATIKGNDWGWGYNLGVMFTPTPSTRFGVAYRSQIKHDLSGDATYAGVPAFGISPSTTNTGATASITLPESLSVSGYADLNTKWAVMGDVSWMRWSRFDQLQVNYANGAPATVLPEQWRDTVRVSAAVNYRYNDAWKLRAGVAYDPSPVKDQFRTARIPDADRTWLAFGAQFKSSAKDTWDIGYAHMFVKDAPINNTLAGGGTLTGSYKNSVDIVSLQYSRNF